MEQQDARKQRLDAEQAWALLAGAESVHAVKGRKVQSWTDPAAARDAVLAAVMGPSGNLRAPTVRVGGTVVVGFAPELYARVLGA